jgi:hypothetical protein
MSQPWRKKTVEQWTEADERAFVEHLMAPAIEAMVQRVRVILRGAAQGYPDKTEAQPSGEKENE